MKRLKKKQVQAQQLFHVYRRCFDYGNDAYDEMLGRLYPEENRYQLLKSRHEK